MSAIRSRCRSLTKQAFRAVRLPKVECDQHGGHDEHELRDGELSADTAARTDAERRKDRASAIDLLAGVEPTIHRSGRKVNGRER